MMRKVPSAAAIGDKTKPAHRFASPSTPTRSTTKPSPSVIGTRWSNGGFELTTWPRNYQPASKPESPAPVVDVVKPGQAETLGEFRYGRAGEFRYGRAGEFRYG